MKIILTQDVAKVGRKNEVKDVNDGFARNFLLGQGKAILATSANLAELERQRGSIIFNQEKILGQTEKFINLVKETPLVIKARASQEGHLFAGLREKDIILAIQKQFGLNLPVELFNLNKVIKQTGEHEAQISLPRGPLGFLIRIEAS